MHPRIFAFGALAMLSAHAANATTYFDTINIPSASLNSAADGPSQSSTLMAQSFYVPGTPDFNSVTLALTAGDPTDNGSTMVFLVPDDGSGNPGIAGNPTTILDPSSSFASGFAGVQIGSIADSALAPLGGAPSLVTLSISPSALATVTSQTSDGEYWIGLVADSNSSIEWMMSADASGVGTANQQLYDNSSGPYGSTAGLSGGSLETIVASPEPASLAIVGGGLVALGYVRRRRPKKG